MEPGYTAALAAALMWRQHWAWRFFWPVAAIGLLVVVVLQERADRENAIVQVRSFYGTLRVTEEATEDAGTFRTLIHGTIQHGTQFMGSEEFRTDATTYYSQDSESGWHWTTAARAQGAAGGRYWSRYRNAGSLRGTGRCVSVL